MSYIAYIINSICLGALLTIGAIAGLAIVVVAGLFILWALAKLFS